MNIDIYQLYEGWRNHLFPPEKIKELISEVHNQRMELCSPCKYNSKNKKRIRMDEYCVVCGCTLVAKTKCLSCDCPKKYWKAVLTEEQEDEINNGKT